MLQFVKKNKKISKKNSSGLFKQYGVRIIKKVERKNYASIKYYKPNRNTKLFE